MLRTVCGVWGLALLSACGAGGSGSGPPATDAQLALAGTPATLTWEGEAYSFEPRVTGRQTGTVVYEILNAPPWASFDPATGRLHGVPDSADVGVYASIRIGASDGTREVWLPAFDLDVEPVSRGAVLLSWVPPSQNTDNSPLEDLAGFRIYGGADPLMLREFAAVDSAGVSSYLLDGLSPGKYYFASAAVNSVGIESDLSNFTVILVR